MTWTVRQAEPADAAEIARINVLSWQYAYRGIVADELLDQMSPQRHAPGWDAWLRRPGADTVFVAEDRTGRIGAYCAVRETPDEGAELLALYGDPKLWGTGAGRAVHHAGVRHLAALGHRTAVLWVFQANMLARNFYRAHGWRPDGAVRDDCLQGREIPTCRYVLRLPSELPRTA
ncbi:RimJ/RimL family protein N-acetyltransferase [Crossiella equi]|uniref:RimJ/RimL family protein N-acetyltransferase n=1 Tax=Crossiella equi TaxID=130796 RepID=A0ABS5AN11_9PSEU|nr:GNAT family N-acetyltransferase [Crossiella equi]MBP2477941.1 RimJ/RimL family protein N-acetyltransferase [Crossiella equi]